MYIRCWGSRGSVPVSGKDYVKYGGDTTCMEIRTGDDDIIIIDAGTGIRRLGNRLIAEKRDEFHLIFTHAHWDHIIGFPFFKPYYAPYAKLRMYRCPFARFISPMLSNMMKAPYFPVSYGEAQSEIIYAEDTNCNGAFSIGPVNVEAIRLSHPNTGSGYKFTENGKTFVFLTDNELRHTHPGGLPYEDYVKFAAGADLLIHDAEYTPDEYQNLVQWGHSAYTHALELAMDAGVKTLGLFHLNQDRTDRQIDEIVDKCRAIIAEKGSDLECVAVASNMEFRL